MKPISFSTLFLTLLLIVQHVISTKLPIIFMHGVVGASTDFEHMVQWTRALGYPSYSLNVYPRLESLFNPMSVQLKALTKAIEETKQRESFVEHHLVCHSQGALMCRTYLQSNAHSVQSFISLSGPHMGQFGLTELIQRFIPKWNNLTRDEIFAVAYTRMAQNSISIASFWKDPFHFSEYRKDVDYLPLYNNESATVNPIVSSFRDNFLRLKKVVFTGSPQDEVIEPYESALFGFYNVSSTTLQMVPMKDQPIYQTDVFGLKTMEQDGRLHMFDVPGVFHVDWLKKEELFKQYVLPYLE